MAPSLFRGGRKGKKSAELRAPLSSARQSLSTPIRTPRKRLESSSCERRHTRRWRGGWISRAGTGAPGGRHPPLGSRCHHHVRSCVRASSVVGNDREDAINARHASRRSGSELRRPITRTRSGTAGITDADPPRSQPYHQSRLKSLNTRACGFSSRAGERQASGRENSLQLDRQARERGFSYRAR
jgi:hypothetical protein